MTTKKDLWGNIKSFDSLSLPYPYICLKEQGDLLSEKTNGLLIGEIVLRSSSIKLQSFDYSVNKFNNLVNNTDFSALTIQSERKDTAEFSALLAPKFDYLFKITVPALNYNYYLLEVAHNSNVYPVIITDLTTDEEQTHKCETQEQFEQVLASILSSSHVKQTIFMLLQELDGNSKHLIN